MDGLQCCLESIWQRKMEPPSLLYSSRTSDSMGWISTVICYNGISLISYSMSSAMIREVEVGCFSSRVLTETVYIEVTIPLTSMKTGLVISSVMTMVFG
jgi:hypothetical protein